MVVSTTFHRKTFHFSHSRIFFFKYTQNSFPIGYIRLIFFSRFFIAPYITFILTSNIMIIMIMIMMMMMMC
mgnify:CR=1 FL=1